MPRSDNFPISRLTALRERRLRREESGRDPDYEKARCRQERLAIQEAVLYASLDTRTLNCPGDNNGGLALAVSKQIDSPMRQQGPVAE